MSEPLTPELREGLEKDFRDILNMLYVWLPKGTTKTDCMIHDLLVVLEAQLTKAKRDRPDRERILAWGNEECFEHPYSSKLKSEEYNRKRHRCPECWQALKEKK